MKNVLRGTSCAVWLLAALLSPQHGYAQGSAFGFQGRLTDGGLPANGVYDLQIGLRDAVSGGNPVGSDLFRLAVPVTNGVFMLQLDFGGPAFSGPARWLEIGVRTNGT